MIVRKSGAVIKAFLIAGTFGLGGRAAINLPPILAASAFDREADGAGLFLSAAGGGAVRAAAVMASVQVLPRYLGDALDLIGMVAFADSAHTESWRNRSSATPNNWGYSRLSRRASTAAS